MKNSMKLIFAVFLITMFQLTAFAQSETTAKINHIIHIGYPSLLFDHPEFGIHLGYNPNLEVTERFSIESQVSYSYGKFEQDDDFFAHNGGYMHTVNVLAGSRFFFTKKERANQLYLNLLLGFGYVKEKELFSDGNSFSITNKATVGYSAGLYFKTKRNISLGIAMETNEITTLKLGYQF